MKTPVVYKKKSSQPQFLVGCIGIMLLPYKGDVRVKCGHSPYGYLFIDVIPSDRMHFDSFRIYVSDLGESDDGGFFTLRTVSADFDDTLLECSFDRDLLKSVAALYRFVCQSMRLSRHDDCDNLFFLVRTIPKKKKTIRQLAGSQ